MNMKSTIVIFKKYSLLLITGSFLGLLLHLAVVGIDVFLIEKPIHIDYEKKFIQSAFSFPFLPILIVEILFSMLICFLWFSMKNALKRAHELDLKNEKHETTVETFQKIMVLMAEHIATNNNQILSKIEHQRRQGLKTSDAIETASQNISKVLHILSEVSFVAPYLSDNGHDPEDLLEKLANHREWGGMQTACFPEMAASRAKPPEQA
ncbi:hypothetical protein [uncultured Desulfosarcina sp.]|uniref:hypothetical protein n=1 Tax=uncultured Desulfosarcina sp. TaxID=218289 RepID=UPI0029C8EA3F|nr:hypothetical protein [uncultured Desulfosarcina sp.]